MRQLFNLSCQIHRFIEYKQLAWKGLRVLDLKKQMNISRSMMEASIKDCILIKTMKEYLKELNVLLVKKVIYKMYIITII